MFSLILLLLTLFCGSSFCQNNRKETSLPSPLNYFKQSNEHSFETNGNSEDPEVKKKPKFGFQIGYGNDLQGYSGSGIVGTYTPLKIDLGGLVIGTVIGLGAVLLAPKILHLFTPNPHYGGVAPYGRSADMISEIGNTISRIDKNLQEMDIDSSSCLQRAACSLVRYVKSSTDNNIFNSSSSSLLAASPLSSARALDAIASSSKPILKRSPMTTEMQPATMDYTASNSLLNFFIDGSKLKNAMDAAIRGEDCTLRYSQCSF